MQCFLDVCYYVTLFLLPIALYSLFRQPKNNRFYTNRDWRYVIKFIFATTAVKKYQTSCRTDETTKKSLEEVQQLYGDYKDNQFIYGSDQNGNSLTLRFSIRAGLVAETFLCLRLSNGAIYTFPGDRIVKVQSISGWQWKTKDLQIDILEPFKRLRLSCNGFLRNSSNDSIEHVKFHFIWTSAASPRFYPYDAATGLLVDALCQKTWRDGDWISLLGDERGYEQFGALHGHVSGDSFPDDLPLYLPSCRTRFWGTADELAVDRSVHLFVAGRDGAVISLWIKAIKDGAELKYGNLITNNGKVFAIGDTDIRLSNLGLHHKVPSLFTAHISAHGGVGFRCVFHLNVTSGVHSHVTSQLSNVPAECDLNSQQARSLVDFWDNLNASDDVIPPPLLVPNKTTVLPQCYVVKFDSEEAKIVQLTGGKGSSLAILTSLKSQKFVIPDGFVVTINAFKAQIESNVKLAVSVAMLDAICCRRTTGDLQQACAATVEAVKNEAMIPTVKQALIEALENVGHKDISERWAVRSSAVGEDGSDLSAAGQNDTFLGLAGVDDVVEAVAACWASLFAFQSVQYRHQHGLPVASQMAVVVQRMVPADSAGVLFTCHPSTANPAHLVITSNHGLGESVVSGRSDPDTIILRRTFDNKLDVLEKTLGLKNEIIRMNDEEKSEESPHGFSITDAQALLLGEVGVLWEERVGHALDIEWAYFRDRLHLLQARPVTTLHTWSDTELLHEFDSATLSEEVAFTGANVGEILPGAISTLALTTSVRYVDLAVQRNLGVYDANVMRCLPTFQHHLFADILQSIHSRVSKTIDLTTKIVDLAIFGHPIMNETIHSWSLMRHGVSGAKQKFKDFVTMIKLAWHNESYLRRCKELVGGVEEGVDERNHSLKDIYVKIEQILDVMEPVLHLHCLVTRTSVSYQVFAMTVLAENRSDFTVDHYNDIAMLLSSCDDVISAQVPATLANIASILSKSGQTNEFCAIRPEEGVAWLETNSPEAYKVFDSFLQEHGHRAMREFDIYQKTWRNDPAAVIKMIQANCKRGTVKQEKATKSLEDIVAELKSPTKASTRKIVKFLIKKGRRAVSCREQSKSECVRLTDKLRTAYGILGTQMALRGLIPSPDVVFHLSHHEVALIIDGSEQAPILITKALKRQKLYTKWNQLTFPEISYGIPRPENREFSPGHGKVKCEGTPACSGTVQGRACVIRDLSEIDQLQEGDVLITFCTDIGWSPYFPMLGGIVTELGGLVSHGAVIAREYGLPCIVGAQGATKMFQTGNEILLSGKTGTIELL